MNRFLLAGNKLVPEWHLKQPGFTHSACGPFTENKERIEKFMQTGNTDFIYKNDLNKACFQHDIAYGRSIDLAKIIASDKFLRDEAFKIASNPKYDSYRRGLASMVYTMIKNLVKMVLLLNQIINFQMNFIGRL